MKLGLNKIGAPLVCAAMLGGSAYADDKITLEVWSWQVIFSEGYERIFEIYEQANPGIEVEFRGFLANEYPTILASGLADSSGPDIAMLNPYDAIAPFALSGRLQSIDEESVPELANFAPESIDAARYDGKIWGIPFAKQAMQIFYNADLFEELGLKAPTKRSEVQPLLDALLEADVIPYSMVGAPSATAVFAFDPLFGVEYGGREFLEAAVKGEASFDSEPMVQALRSFQDSMPYYPPFVTGIGWADYQALFSSGRAAMLPGGAWELGGMRERTPDMKIGVFSMPADDSGDPAPTWGYEDGSLAISAATEHPEEALKLLRWMATPEFGQAFTDELFQMSSVLGVEPKDPTLAQIVKNFEANPVPKIWVTKYHGRAAPAPFATLSTALADLLSGSTTPEEAARRLERDAREFEELHK